jgi:ABC-type branched-subunit amino acid transport system substrate-binding protein
MRTERVHKADSAIPHSERDKIFAKQTHARRRTVKFEYSDDESNPQVAVQLASGLIAKKVPLIFGPIFTATCQAVAPLVDKAGPVSFCLSPAIFPRQNGYMFMGAPSIDDVQPVLFRYLTMRKLRKIAMITSTDASGADFEKRVDGVLAAPEFKDLNVVTREHFGIADISVSAQMSRIKAVNPDVLLTFTVGTPFGTLLKGIHDAGLDIPIWFGQEFYVCPDAAVRIVPSQRAFHERFARDHARPNGDGRCQACRSQRADCKGGKRLC